MTTRDKLMIISIILGVALFWGPILWVVLDEKTKKIQYERVKDEYLDSLHGNAIDSILQEKYPNYHH